MYNTRFNGKDTRKQGLKCCGQNVCSWVVSFHKPRRGIFGGGLEQTEGVTEREREIAEDKSEMIKRSKETKLQLATYPIAQNYHVV